jgi:ArsR family transcriptional regulator
MTLENSDDLLKSQFKSCQKLLIAIGDEIRQMIILTLIDSGCEKGLRVGEITEKTHLSRPAISHHLKILLDSEVIGMTSEGTKNYYWMKLGGEWVTLVSLINGIEQLRKEEGEKNKNE